MKCSNMIGALSVAALAFLSSTVDASTAAAQTSGHLRHSHGGHNRLADGDDDYDSIDNVRSTYGKQPRQVTNKSVYGDGDNDSFDDYSRTLGKQPSGRKKQSGYNDDDDSLDKKDQGNYGKSRSTYRN